jgi:D-serine deaminase-like pyridoxal phosphate-dependent protein
VTTARSALQKRLDRVTAHLETPLAVVDLDAFDDNAATLTARSAGKPIWWPASLPRAGPARIAGRPGVHLPEAIWLIQTGVTDDVPVAYPSVDRRAIRELTMQPDLAAAIARGANTADRRGR